MQVPEFVNLAPCASADPWLFDQSSIDLAMPALNYCRFCPFWIECDEWVAPGENAYDGVVGGKVWRNGRILARLDINSPNNILIGDGCDGTQKDINAVEF